MRITERIRTKASKALDVLIPEGRWEQYVEMLDREGKFTKRSLLTMVLLLCRSVEELELHVERLYEDIDQLSKQKQSIKK